MKTGRVIYSSGGNYKVLSEGEIYNAKPRGIFRKDKIKILVGDIVDFSTSDNSSELNTIDVLHDRKNEFKRPNISNIDYAIIVASIVEPKLDTLLIDKFITIFQTNNIEPILVFTKADISKDIDLSEIKEYKDAGYKVLVKHMDDVSIIEN
jgi:ribosome biogenesis GTPase